MHEDAANPGEASALARFVAALAAEGRAVVLAAPLEEDYRGARAALAAVDAAAREELGLEAPPFAPAAALWAARLCYQLCQFTVCRDLGEEHIQAACARPCPEPRGPATEWSVDLTLRHLPRLFQLAHHLSHADPLLQHMRRLAAAWPLSSVGIASLDPLLPEAMDPVLVHPALRRLYVDRVLARGDLSRLRDPRVADLLRTSLGLHGELAPEVAGKLGEQKMKDEG
jgi:hypothetical protein